jgi:hypothetical protein
MTFSHLIASSRVVPFLFSLFAVACSSSSSSSGVTTTSTVAPKTIDGVCSKLNQLSCAQPNCTEKLTLAQSRCVAPGDDFQGALDCLAIATFTCGGSPTIPRTNECEADLQRIDLCSSRAPSGPGDSHAPVDAGPFDAGSTTCKSADDCTNWSCLCADGTDVHLAGCENGACSDPVTLCAATSPPLIEACKAHGGTQ